MYVDLKFNRKTAVAKGSGDKGRIIAGPDWSVIFTDAYARYAGRRSIPMTKINAMQDADHELPSLGQVDSGMIPVHFHNIRLAFMIAMSFAWYMPLGAQRPTLYLTVDDGPSKGTRQLYELADSERVMVNLFIIGSQAARADSMGELFRKWRTDSLVLICNHSYSHAGGHYRQYYRDASAVVKDFDRNRDTLRLDNNIARMPGRNYWRLGRTACGDIPSGAEAADSLAAHGYQVFGWDLEWKCDSLPGGSIMTGKEMLERGEKMLRNRQTVFGGNLVILLHDPEFAMEGFCREVREFIRLARKRGYRIAHLSEFQGN
jgi:peptidoglycan/xylan/chitin deacetylase (PgdA/CDA1 family)